MIRVSNPLCSPLLEQASALRRAGSLCDVVFSVGGQRFRAHRLVLACASPSLVPELLQEAPDRLLHLALDLCSPRTFQQVLDYSYGRALALPPGDLAPLRIAAGLLGMAPLEEQCRRLLESPDHRAGDPRPAPEDHRTSDPRPAPEDHRTSDPRPAPEDHRTGDPRPAPEDAEEWRADGDACALRSPVPDETVPRNVSPEEETEETGCPPTPPPPTSDTPQDPAGEAPSKKRVVTSSMLAAPYSRDSVIRASSPCPPWSYVNNCPPWASVNNWHHVTLRLMAQGYSNLLAVHSLQHPPPLAPHALHPSPGPTGLGPPDSAHVQPRRRSAGSPDLEGTLRPETCPEAESCEPRCFKRVPSPQHVFLSPLHVSHVSKKCSPSSGQAYHRYVSRGGGGGVNPPGAKPFQCQECPKRFSLKHQLETHHRVHTGEKPFECRLCGQRSRDYSAMIKHLRTHGGAGPYRCTACQDFCSSLVAMQKHMERHAAQDFPPDWTIRDTYLYTSHV